MIRAAALAAILSGAPALACSPALIEPSPFPRQGPDCAYAVDLNEIDAVHLGPTERLAGGLVMQALSEGNGCYARFHLVVHDCATRRVMVIGPENFSLMDALDRDPNERPGVEVIREAAQAASAAGQPMSPDDFTTMSRAQGYGEPQVLRTTDSLQFERQTVPLACACREAGG